MLHGKLTRYRGCLIRNTLGTGTLPLTHYTWFRVWGRLSADMVILVSRRYSRSTRDVLGLACTQIDDIMGVEHGRLRCPVAYAIDYLFFILPDCLLS